MKHKKLFICMLTLVEFVLMTYLMICVGMFALQRKLMYFPDKHIESPAHYGLVHARDITLTSKDGTKLQAWEQAAKPGFPTLVYFHGNASNHSFRADKFVAYTQAGFGLLAIHYRGYGKSEGTPSEMGIYDDARAAMEYAMHTMKLPTNKIVLYGESLGSGVAVQMATEYDVAAVVLEAPYTSVEDRASELYWFLPTRLILRDKYYSSMKIKSVHVPLLIFHGDHDIVIPIHHARTLFGLANEPKQLIEFPGGGHTDFPADKLTAYIIAFLKKQGIIGALPPNT